MKTNFVVRFTMALLLLGSVLGIVWVGILIGRQTATSAEYLVAYSATATFLFGVSVGLSELLSHYRDEPLAAAATPFGLSYLVPVSYTHLTLPTKRIV